MSNPSSGGDRIYEAFLQASNLPGSQREELLARLGLTPEQLAEVRLLLANIREHGAAASPISELVGELRSDMLAATATAAEPPASIGSYRVVSRIGEGGMGVVYLARQSKPDRRVALKLIRPGFASARMLKRFEYEAEVLGRLLHPGIAQIYEAGMADLGSGPQPFFAMELVEGVSLTRFAKEKDLGTRARLELFAKICDAVHHAHQKGVIHRDLKPGNILVTADGQPKILDFGVARTTDGDIQNTTLQTDIGQLIGTLPYMSPEQVGGKPEDLDTRSDVYALGVVLYELLVGRLPYTLEKRLIHEAARIIKEEEPTRLSSIDRTLRGDVETIVGHALEKDKTRRYQGASSLAADIRRYLSDEPIAARPAGTWYQLRKFSQRNKALVGGVVVALVLLTAGVLGTGLALNREAQQRLRADERAAAAEKAEGEAKDQTKIAEAVAKFQTDMLAAVDPSSLPTDPVTKEPLRDRITVLQAVQAAVKQLDDGSLKDQPLVEARVRAIIGQTLSELARYDAAEPNLRKSLAILRSIFPAGHPDIAGRLDNLAGALQFQSKHDEAEPLFREALEIRRAVLPASDPEMAISFSNLGVLLLEQNKLAEAEPLFREALTIRRATQQAGHPDIALSLNNLAMLLRDQNKFAEAEPLFREALAIRRATQQTGHPDVALSLNNLALLLRDQNKFAEAESLYREALEMNRAAFAAGHPAIALNLNNLAMLLRIQNKLAEAEPLFREALEIRRAAHQAGHQEIALSLNSLALLLRDQNKFAEAEPLFREALAIRRAAFPAGHPHVAFSLNGLAVLLRDQDKLAEAEPLFREALEMLRAGLPAGHPNIATTLNELALLLKDQNKPAEARAGWDEAIAMLRNGSPDGSALLARVLWRSGSARLEGKDAAAAQPELEEAVAMAEKYLPADHPQLNEFRETLAKCKAALGK